MKYFIFIILICILISTSKAQNLYEIAKIKINTAELSSKHQFSATEFFTSSKKKIAKNYCFDVFDIIESHIKQLSNSERKRLVIIAESASGESIVSTISDYDKDIVKITPLLIYEKVTGRARDTVTINDEQLKKGANKFKDLDNKLMLATQKKIYLQFSNFSKDDIEKTFSNATIIFPQDQSSERWLKNVTYIKLYLLK